MEKSEEMLSINNFFDNDQLNDVSLNSGKKLKISNQRNFFMFLCRVEMAIFPIWNSTTVMLILTLMRSPSYIVTQSILNSR